MIDLGSELTDWGGEPDRSEESGIDPTFLRHRKGGEPSNIGRLDDMAKRGFIMEGDPAQRLDALKQRAADTLEKIGIRLVDDNPVVSPPQWVNPFGWTAADVEQLRVSYKRWLPG